MLLNKVSVIADQICTYARSLGLNLSYHEPTIGDGNCWYHAIVQQMKRPEVAQSLEPDKLFLDHFLLRNAVVNYIQSEENTNIYIMNYKELYSLNINEENDNESWQQFLSNQKNISFYATELFCQATAAFLGIDIYITSNTSTRNQPFIYLSKSWTVGQENMTSFFPMLIGSISQNHFQSLIPYSPYPDNENIDFSIERPTTRVRKAEMDYKEKCLELNLPYIIPTENSKVRKVERQKIRRSSQKRYTAEERLEASCKLNGVSYVCPSLDETRKEKKMRHQRLLRMVQKAKSKTLSETDPVVISNILDDICEKVSLKIRQDADEEIELSSNPAVSDAIKIFEYGEMQHSVGTCRICDETRPVFFSPKPSILKDGEPKLVSNNG